jgi:hypothetical protein
MEKRVIDRIAELALELDDHKLDKQEFVFVLTGRKEGESTFMEHAISAGENRAVVGGLVRSMLKNRAIYNLLRTTVAIVENHEQFLREKVQEMEMREMDSDECRVFNMNSHILVKLKDKGYRVLADYHNKYSSEYRDAAYFKNKADEQGYTEFQLWVFMNQFGHLMLNGSGHKYLDINIRIPNKSFKNTTNK